MNVKLGKYNQLEVVKEVDFGVYLDGGDDGEILLPTRYVPEGCKPGDVLNVFLYLDNEERLIATTLQPLVQVDEFACLEVAWINEFGAFLNWGLMKDLFVPFREQKMKMQKGRNSEETTKRKIWDFEFGIYNPSPLSLPLEYS